MHKKFIPCLLIFLCLFGSATAHSADGSASVLGGGGTNSNASPTIETDEFTGAATYSIQIPLPPARGGLNPNLALTYNSFRRNHNSWVGLGWDLSLGSIVRIPEPVSQDYYSGSIDFSNLTSTRFQVQLGGQSEELALVRRNVNGADYGIATQSGERVDLFQARVESAFTYYLHRYIYISYTDQQDLGWVAIDKSGIRYYFGQSSESQTNPLNEDLTSRIEEIQQWMVDRIEDPNGNYLEAHYAGERLDSIQYQDILVKFNLAPNIKRHFPSFREEPISKFQLGKILDHIIISQNSSRLQKFQFQYSTTTYRGTNHLISVQQFGKDAGASLPPINLQYYDETPMQFSQNPNFLQAGSQNENGLVGESLTFADMNGDGRVDQVMANEDGSFTVRFNNGNDFVEIPGKSHWPDPFACGGAQTDDPPCMGKLNAFRNGHQWMYLMDMNGDGLPDRMGRVIVANRGQSDETAHFRIAFNTGTGWDPNTVEWRDPYQGGWAGTSDEDKGFIDMNGDGLVDRVVGNIDVDIPNGFKGKAFYVYYNTGAGFRNIPISWHDPLSGFQQNNSGEGKIYHLDGEKTVIFIRDMNGDGLPDRVFKGDYYDPNGTFVGVSFAIATNTNGRGWAPFKFDANQRALIDGIDNLAILDPVTDGGGQGVIDKTHDWIDVNGDGFLDRVEGDTNQGVFRIYFYRGFQDLDNAANLSNPITLNDPVSNQTWDSQGYITGMDGDRQHTFFQDFNGDGYPDRLKVITASQDADNQYAFFPLRVNEVEFSDSPSWWTDRLISQPVGALKSVDTGTGQKTAIEYRPATRPQQPDQPDHRFLPFNLNLVHKIYTLDPTLAPGSTLPEAQRFPGMRWITYQFRGGNFFVLHAQKANSSITDDTLSRIRFARFNGFQEVKKTPSIGPGENWSLYETTNFYHQAIGNAGPSSNEPNLFDDYGYTHFGLSGKPYREVIEQNGNVVVEQTSAWIISQQVATDGFDCVFPNSLSNICFPQLKFVTKKVWEGNNQNFRISQIGFEYDDFGNKTREASYSSSGQPLVWTDTQYHDPSYFQETLLIRDRPQTQSKQTTQKVYRRKSFQYDSKGNPTGETFFANDSGSQTLTITRDFNSNGTLKSITDTDGTTKELEYDTEGLFPITETLKNGVNDLTTNRAFNRLNGEAFQEIIPQGVGKSVVFDDFGRPLENHIHPRTNSGQPSQLVRRLAYDYVDITFGNWPDVRLLKTEIWEPKPNYPTTHAIPAQISYSGPSGEIYQACQLSERGNYRLVQYRSRNGGQEEIQTEPVFSSSCVFLPTIAAGTRVFLERKDLLGRTTYSEPSIGDADSPTGNVSISYHNQDAETLIKTIVAPKNQTRIESYDINDRLIKVVDANNAILSFEYNPVGDLEKTFGQDVLLTSIEYDLLGRKRSMTDADLGTWTYDYDQNGRLWKQTDAKGQVIEQLYDSIGRLSRKNIFDAGQALQRYEEYSYDTGDTGYSVEPGELYEVEEFGPQNQLLRRTRTSYDPAYRRAEKLSRYFSGLGEFSQSFVNDHLGRPIETQYPGGHKLIFTYMINGNLRQVCGQSCGSGDQYYSLNPSNAYDVFGSLLTEDYGNGVKSDYEYFPNSHRLRSKKTYRGGDTYSERTYSHDEFSNITMIGDPLNAGKAPGTSGGIESTQYDNLNRLTGYKMVGSSVAQTMEYDAEGNVKKNSASFGNQDYKYNGAQRHAVTSVGTNTFSYDANGNMITDPHRTMDYDARNHLIRVRMKNKSVVDYDYDYTGSRVSKIATSEDLLRKSKQVKTYYLGEAMELRGDQMILNVYAGSRKVATRVLGKVTDGLSGTSALILNGIELEFRPTMAMPYVFILLALFILASFRPMRLPWPYRRVVPAIVFNFYRKWRWYQVALQDTVAQFHFKAGIKSFLLFLAFLFLFQTTTNPVFAGETGLYEEPPSDTEYFFYNHDDHLGSSQLITEGKIEAKHSGLAYKEGDLLQRFEYSPFGQERFVLNPNFNLDPSFTGQRYDVETGLYFYKSRYYNPQLARFIQPDSVVPDAQNLQAYNRYSYVNNNPLKYVDPTGHFWGWFKKIFAAFIGALISVFTGFVLAPFVGALLAAVIGGLIGGTIGGAITGGIKGALLGAVFGAAGGAAFGAAGSALSEVIGKWGSFGVLTAVGASISAATGGWRGLVIFGAGLAGAFAGYFSGKPVGQKIESWKNSERGSGPVNDGSNGSEELVQFEPGEGMTSYESPDNQWARREVAEALKEIGEYWKIGSGGEDPIQIGDISRMGGGNFSPHRGHKIGLEVDIRPGHIPGHTGRVGNYMNNSNYSAQQTQLIVDVFRSHYQVNTIYFNDPAISGVTPWPGHNDHLHIKLSP